MKLYGGGLGPDGKYNPARTVVLAIRSGDEILRVANDEIAAALGLSLQHSYWDVWLRRLGFGGLDHELRRNPTGTHRYWWARR